MSLCEQYPTRLVCETLDFPRSQLYRPPPDTDKDAFLREALLRLAGEWPTYGYRRLTAMLKRDGWKINAKRVRRVLAEMGILREQPARRRRTTNSNHAFSRYPNLVEHLEIKHPDHVWVADITYIRLKVDFVYLAVIMDVYTRFIRGWHLGRSLETELTLTALGQALEKGKPEIHHSDQGVQYASSDYVDRLLEVKARISMAKVGEPRENGYAERLMRTIKEEEVALTEYQDYADAYRQLGRFLDCVYNHKRIHSSLGYLTPEEYEQQWRKEQCR
jgi:transposase InsO family protein